MSYIFEAIQKAAAEGNDNQASALFPIPDLLQAIDRKADADHVTEADKPMLGNPPAVVDQSALLALSPSALEVAASVSAEPVVALPKAAESPGDSAIEQFRHFQSLKVLVPKESRLVCITEQGSLAAEKFRYLAVRLRQLQHSRPLKKVLVTSTIPQEGKSMVAANLACTLSRRVLQKTLLLDGDLRRPTVASRFGLGNVPGIGEWLQGEESPITNIYQLEGTRLWILPAGSTPTNPLELMQSGRMSRLMEQLTTWFDWIIIDSPPVLPLADTSLWMRLADGILLVARQGITQRELLNRGIQAIESSKLLGAVLNGSTNTVPSDYYYQPAQS